METFTDDRAAAACIAEEDILICFFNAPWVGPGRLAKPFVESIAGKLAIRVVEIDVDQCRATALTHDVQSAPATILFKKGVAVANVVGMRPEHMIQKEIQAGMGR